MIDKFRGFSFTKHFKLFGLISLLLISVGLVSLILTLCGVPRSVFSLNLKRSSL